MGNHKPLVTKELFDICQYIAAQQRQFLTRARKHSFLLRGLLYCSVHMGKRKTGGYGANSTYQEGYLRLTADRHDLTNSKNRNEISYYHCSARGGCPTTSVATEILERQVAGYIKKMEFKSEFIELVKNKVRAILDKNNAIRVYEHLLLSEGGQILSTDPDNIDDFKDDLLASSGVIFVEPVPVIADVPAGEKPNCTPEAQ